MKHKPVKTYILLGAITLLLVTAAALLPLALSQALKEDAVNAIGVAPLESMPVARTPEEESWGQLETALTLLYLNLQDPSFTEADEYSPQNPDAGATVSIRQEMQQLKDLGLPLEADYAVNGITGFALKNLSSDDTRADYNAYILTAEDGICSVTTEANSGNILAVELFNYAAGSEAQQQTAKAFAQYLELGDITLLSQQDDAGETTYSYFASGAGIVVAVGVRETSLEVMAYPYSLYPKGE